MLRQCIAMGILLMVGSVHASTTLTILNWDDYVAPEVISGFEQQYGVEVEYVPYTSLDEFAGLFYDQDNRFDLIFPPSRIINVLKNSGLILDLDTSQIPQYNAIRQDIQAEFVQHDDGAASGVPYLWGTTGLGVNRKQLEALGLSADQDSWRLLFDAETRQKAAQCGIGLLNERDELFAAALAWLGYSVNTVKKPELVEAGELLKEAISDVAYLHTTQFRQDLKDNKICVAVGYSGDLQAVAAENPEVSYFIPKEGNALWMDAMVIPANATSPQLAYHFINYVMQSQVAASNTNYLAYPNAVDASSRYIDSDIISNPHIYPSEASLNKMEALAPKDRKTARVMHRLWVNALCNRGGWCSVPPISMF